jgi:two-component system chemotaxis sensor kinase CheA
VAVDLTRFLPMFFEETEEHLANMEAQLLRLNSDAPDPEALHSIFRAAHSVKGNSALLGATRFSEVMHRIENILDRIRKEQLTPDNDVITLLLEACDVVRDQAALLRDKGQCDDAALNALYEQLTRFAPTQHAVAALPGIPAPARRSERLSIEVDLPSGQGITGLPLANLYAELATLGRLEDVRTDGSTSLALILLTAQPGATVRARLNALLGTDGVRVSQYSSAPRPPVITPSPMQESSDQCGLFEEETSLAQASGAISRSKFGRRASDHESTGVMGRRVSDRLHLDRSSIRVDVEKLDRLLNLVGELVIAQSMLSEATALTDAQEDARLRDSIGYVGRQTRELQEAVMAIRLLPIDYLFSRIPRLVRDLARRLDKEVELTTQGAETELDKEMIEKLADPILHLVRNSLDHGIESPQAREAAGKERTGKILLRATQQGGGVVIEIIDDGAGFNREKILARALEKGMPVDPGISDEELWQLIFVPGFSTADEVSEISGRGVGMDVVKRNIRALGGHIELHSRAGAGVHITIRLPLTLAILDGMNVEIAGETFIVPLSLIAEAFLPQGSQIKTVASGTRVVQIRDAYLPLLSTDRLLGLTASSTQAATAIAIVVDVDGRRAALLVDRLLGQQQVVIKSLEANYRRVPGIAGATVLGNGRVALILDINALLHLDTPAAARQGHEPALGAA